MADRLPYEDTKVPEIQSIMSIQALLQEVGFKDTALIQSETRKAVIAAYKGAEFKFEVDPRDLVKLLRRESRFRRHTSDALLGKAVRQGWRYIFHHVKMVCDGIRLGILSPIEGFAGHLQIKDRDGRPIPLAHEMLVQIESGNFAGKTIQTLLPPPAVTEEK